MSFLCLKYVCECMTICQCGNLFATTQEKYIGPNPRSIRKHCKPRIIVPHQLLQEKNPWQQNHDKARDASRSATKKSKYISVWDRWQRDEVYRASQLAHNWTDDRVKYLDCIAHFDIRHDAPHWQRARFNSEIHLRSLDSIKQPGPLCKRPGYKEVTRSLMSLQYAEGQEVLFIRTRQNNTLDP